VIEGGINEAEGDVVVTALATLAKHAVMGIAVATLTPLRITLIAMLQGS